MTNPKLIKLEIKLPDHQNELSDAESNIGELKSKVHSYEFKSFTDDIFLSLYEEVISNLDYVGRLSSHLFELNKELEESYYLKYKRAPAMAKTLWMEHYTLLHQPYNTLKNRCFKLLDKLDYYYKDNNYCNPPNWKP